MGISSSGQVSSYLGPAKVKEAVTHPTIPDTSLFMMLIKLINLRECGRPRLQLKTGSYDKKTKATENYFLKKTFHWTFLCFVHVSVTVQHNDQCVLISFGCLPQIVFQHLMANADHRPAACFSLFIPKTKAVVKTFTMEKIKT